MAPHQCPVAAYSRQVGRDGDNRADEARPARARAGEAGQLAQEARDVGGVGAGPVHARVAGAGDARRPAQRLDLEAGVVGEDEQVRSRPRLAARARAPRASPSALPRALAANDSAPSGGSSMPSGIGSTSSGARIVRNSPSLWRLPVASMKRTAPALSPAPATAAACAAARAAAPLAARSSSSSSVVARVRLALGRGLHLDEPAVAGHHDVHVDRGGGVLLVVEVEQRAGRRRRRPRRRDIESKSGSFVQPEQLLELERHLVHGHVGAR